MTATRQSVYTEAFGHSNPVPAACRMGPLVMTGIINGLEDGKPGTPATLAEQCALMFQRVGQVIAAAGGSTGQIVKVNIAVADLAEREPINREWVALFPNPASRTVRQTVAASLDRGKLIQCDLVAWIEQPRG